MQNNKKKPGATDKEKEKVPPGKGKQPPQNGKGTPPENGKGKPMGKEEDPKKKGKNQVPPKKK